MGTQIQVENDPVIPKAEYPAIVSRYQANIPGNPQYGGGSLVRIFFKITEGQFANCEATKQFNQRISPRTDLYAFLRTVGVAIPDQIGVSVDLDQMLNKPLIVTVEPNQTARGTYNNVIAWRSFVPAYVPPVPAGVPTTPQPVTPSAVVATAVATPAPQTPTIPPATTPGPRPSF